MTIEFPVTTSYKTEFIDITQKIKSTVKQAVKEYAEYAGESGDTANPAPDGICTVFCPHTTAAVTINENADSDVLHDLEIGLDKAFPDRNEFRHSEGNSSAHLKSSCVGASETVPINQGRLVLGTWQGIYFCEFDGPRNRKCIVQIHLY